MTKTYNGFTGPERIRGWQVQWWLIERGHLAPLRSLTCVLCGVRQKVHYHLEDYYDPLRAGIELCSHCHRALHRRFRYPDSWQAVLARNGCDAEEWAERLTESSDADLATLQLERYGEFVRTCTQFIPERELFPLDQLQPLDSDVEPVRARQLRLDL